MPAKSKKSTAKKSTAKKSSKPVASDHLGSKDSFQFALHVATLSVLIVAFVTLLSQIGGAGNQDNRSQATSVSEVVEQEEVVVEPEESVLGVESYDYNYYQDESLEDGYYEDDFDRFYDEAVAESSEVVLGVGSDEGEDYYDENYGEDVYYENESSGSDYYEYEDEYFVDEDEDGYDSAEAWENVDEQPSL